MRTFLMLAGLGTLGLTLGSLAVPFVLKWSIDTARMRPLTRQIFQTYAVYIWTTNLAFGLLSFFHPEWLLDGSPLGRALAGFITLYWGARLLIQFLYYDRSARPAGAQWVAAEWSIILLFIYLTGVYGHIAVYGG
jgi:hypothetical protein